METYRRIVEVFTGEEKNKFFTIRLDVDLDMTDEQIIAGWSVILAAFRLRYETQVKFAHPPPGHNPDLYMPPLEGEAGWTWGGEELLE